MMAGEERAFERFFELHFPPLWRFAMKRMGQDPDGAEDVVQSTLWAGISKLSTYRGEASLLTWLCSFCRHEISRYYERRGRAVPTVELSEDNPEVRAALESAGALDDAVPDRALVRGEVGRLVHVALDHLPAHYASALEWKYVEDLSVREIGERLGVSAKAAESLLARARQAFRDAFSTLTRPGGLSWSDS
jgi:RNA polymerase sigma-70 factor (ECF subfamily)